MSAPVAPGNTQDLSKALCQLAQDQGFDAAGICDPSLDDDDKQAWLAFLDAGQHGHLNYLRDSREARAQGAQALLPEVGSVLVVAQSYHQPALDKTRPAIARYAMGKDYHKTLRTDLARLMKRAVVELQLDPTYRLCVDTAPLLERAYARRAGLGWIGRNGMLVSRQLGSYTLLGAVLLKSELPSLSAFDPASLVGCGACRACVSSCPTGAILDVSETDYSAKRREHWPTNLPGRIDARRCIATWSIEHRGEFSDATPDYQRWIFGCDRCQEVCPLNVKAAAASDPRLWARPALRDLNSQQIQDQDDSALSACIAGSPVKRAGVAGLRRNARWVNAQRGVV